MHIVINARHAIIKELLCKYETDDEFVHFYIHSSGLFYGHINNHLLSKFSTMNTWSVADHYKVALIEGMFGAYIFRHKHDFLQSHDKSIFIEKALQKIFEFYVVFTIKESYYARRKPRFSYRKHSQIFELEKIINFRVNTPTMLNKGFWKGLHFNVFSYLDILFFLKWLRGDYLFDKQKEIKTTILRAMISASFVDEKESKQDNTIIHYFIASGNVTADVEKELEHDIAQKLPVNSIHINSNFPPLIRMLMYEHALIVLLNNAIEIQEKHQFLSQLAELCNLSEDETDYSTMLVENFIVHNTKHILYLRQRFRFDFITNNFASRFSTFFTKNKAKITTELQESKELMELLWKAKNEKLSDEEREKVKKQSIDLLRTIPSLAIFMIPGGSIVLPLLLKIIPEEILIPSSFRNS